MTATAYPLSWPIGWKRTAANYRSTARFSRARRQNYNGKLEFARPLTINEAVDRLQAELDRIGARQVVLSSNLELRLDGQPRSGQREPSDPGAAIYWTTADKQNRALAIDIYDRVADNIAALAATIEAMRAIERHGGAVVMERAYTGFTALPAPTERDWQAVLELQALLTPTRDDVEKAYRRLASLRHPDKGGSNEGMAELNRARDEALEAIK